MQQPRFACLRCAVYGHFVSAESPCGRIELLNLAYFANLFNLYKFCEQKLKIISQIDPKI